MLKELGVNEKAGSSVIHRLGTKTMARVFSKQFLNIHQLKKIDFCFLILLIIVTAVIATLYISNEKTLYFWDYANYSNQTFDSVSALRELKPIGIRSSFSTDYNKLPCLPIIPFVLIFGESRLVYILSSALVYIVPFALVMGVIASKIITVYPRAVFWSTAFLTLLIPGTWISILRGYPDLGGAVIIGLAVLVYLKDVKLNHWWQTPVIGFLLALAMLFRRHFAYSARAFLVAITLQGLIIFILECRQDKKRALRNLISFGAMTALIAVSSLVTLKILAPGFLDKIVNTDYRTLYASYESPASVVFQYFLGIYGWLNVFLTLVGFFLGTLTRILVRPAISFIVIFGSISLIQWSLFAKQGGIHYGTHFLFFFVLGLISFIWTIWIILKGKVRIFILGTTFLFLTINTVVGLTPLLKLNNSILPLFAFSNPPLVRQDYNEVIQLIDFLRQITSNQDPIYVASSSGSLNHSLVREGEGQIYGRDHKKLDVLTSSDVDSRDFYPLENLLQAQYVIVVTPSYFKTGENVIKASIDPFTENWQFAQDFKRLSEQFILDDSDQDTTVTVSIYQRIKPTSLETAVQTLHMMQELIKQKPGGQSDWIILNKQKGDAIITKENTVDINIAKASKLSLLYLGTMPEKINLSGQIKFSGSQCNNISLSLATLNQQGKIINQGDTLKSSQTNNNFTLEIDGQKADYLLLDLVSHDGNNQIGECSWEINQLKVSSPKNEK